VSDRILINKVEPPGYVEETLAIRHLLSKGRDRDFVVVTGTVHFDATNEEFAEIKGSEESDSTYVEYEIHATVGPYWDVIGQNKGDVSPLAVVSDYAHHSPDTADTAGYGIHWCGWTVPAAPTVQKRIELIIWLFIRGGVDAMIGGIAYHFSAYGKLSPSPPNPPEPAPEPDNPNLTPWTGPNITIPP
jgi:hypothetical protein